MLRLHPKIAQARSATKTMLNHQKKDVLERDWVLTADRFTSQDYKDWNEYFECRTKLGCDRARQVTQKRRGKYTCWEP